MSRCLSFEREVWVDVDVSLDELAKNLTREDLAYMAQAKGCCAPGTGEGDPGADRYVDAAEAAARQLNDCPRAILDLLWHVHGRAIG